MNSLGERLKSLRKQKGLTQQELANKLSLNRSTLANWELDRTKPDCNDILQMADLHGVPVEILIREKMANPEDKMVKVPVYRGKAELELLKNPQIISWESVPAITVLNGDYFFLLIPDKSLTKMNIPQGAKILVRKQDNIASGKIALLLIKAQQLTIRRVKFHKKLVVIYADKKEEPAIYRDSDIEIIGQIVEIRTSVET